MGIAALCGCALPANALYLFEPHNKLYVHLTSSLAWSSNLNAQEMGEADFIATTGFGVEFSRHAGTLSVDAMAEAASTHYRRHPGENELNPRLGLTISKSRGRLTGALDLLANRETQADTNVHLRTTAWSYPLGLTLHYPVNTRYALNSSTSYARISYAGDDGLADYADFAQSLNVAYALSSKLDMTAGYRARFSRTSYLTRAVDHMTTMGLSGAIGPRLRGEISAGHQNRQVRPGGRAYSGMNAAADLTWTGLRKVTVTGRLARDFSTTARAANVQTLTANLIADLALTRRFSIGGGLTAGRNDFMDDGNESRGRRDRTFGRDAHATYRLSARVELSASAARIRTWSSDQSFDLEQESWQIGASTRW